MANLTIDQNKYFDEFEEMFGTNGWKALLGQLEQEIYEIQADALEAKTWDEVLKYRGRADAWAYLRNLPGILEFQKAELEAGEDENVIPNI